MWLPWPPETGRSQVIGEDCCQAAVEVEVEVQALQACSLDSAECGSTPLLK